jgi:hypothetical protein
VIGIVGSAIAVVIIGGMPIIAVITRIHPVALVREALTRVIGAVYVVLVLLSGGLKPSAAFGTSDLVLHPYVGGTAPTSRRPDAPR